MWTYVKCWEDLWQQPPDPPRPAVHRGYPEVTWPVHRDTARSRIELVAIKVFSDEEMDTNMTNLRDIQVRLHDEERIQCVGTGSIGVIKEILDFGEGSLPETCTTILRGDVSLRMCLFEPQGLWSMTQSNENSLVQGLYFLKSCGCELALGRRSFIHSYTHEDLTKQRKNPWDVI